MLPGTNSGIPRNRSDAPRNPRIVPGSILAPRKDPTVPRNTEPVPGNIYHGPLDQYTGQDGVYFRLPEAPSCQSLPPRDPIFGQ
jgi:hypothetical protein